MSNWGIEVVRALKEGKWLAIQYQNMTDEIKKFWIAIQDIEPTKKLLYVDVYNDELSRKVIKDYKIHYDKILSATVIENTIYRKPEKLLEKINQNLSEFLFLEDESLSERVLMYYLECFGLDNEPFQTQYALVSGMDFETIDSPEIPVNEEMYGQFMDAIKKQLKIHKGDSKILFEKVIINCLSINSSEKGIFPIAYKNVLIDLENRKLILDPKMEFNANTIQLKSGPKLYISSYLDVDFTYFKDNFETHYQEFTDMIRSRLNRHEKLDEMPYFLKMSGMYGINLKDEYSRINDTIRLGTINPPLKSFFGLDFKETPKRRSVIVDSKKINKNQLRVVYNALNRNVLFVQGPPGTGKTTSIVNIVHSCLFNDETCLLVSGNNEAVDHVISKLMSTKYRDEPILYPLLRLGRDELIESSLNQLRDRVEVFRSVSLPSDFAQNYKKVKDLIKSKMSGVNEILKDYEDSLALQDNLHTLQDFRKIVNDDTTMEFSDKSMTLIGIDAQIEALKSKVTDRDFADSAFNTEFIDEDLIKEFLYLSSLHYGKAIFRPSNRVLLDIIDLKDPKDRMKEFKLLIKEDEGMKILMNCFPIIVSTIMSSTKLGRGNGQFDLLIIEEASQANPALSLVPMHRAKRACFIGDPNQLQPIVSITTERNAELMGIYNVPSQYSYKDNSILTMLLKTDQNSKYILLNKHYRCAKKIINFSNKKYYNNALNLDEIPDKQNTLKLIDVPAGKTYEKNTSITEVNAIVKEIQATPKDTQVAVITPFRNQAKLIQEQLEKVDMGHIKVGSIHTFQGQESDKIIVSAAITEKTGPGAFEWVKNNKELINVMTTRAKDNLVVIADVARVEQMSCGEPNDFLDLVRYMNVHGDAKVEYKENTLFDSKVIGYKQLNSESELEFLKTITHLRSVYRQFNIKTLKKVTDVLDLTKEQTSLFGYANQAHFDFVLYDLAGKPLLAIEIMGHEHYNDPRAIQRDKMKMEICKRHNLKLISIPNESVRQYNLIKSIIIKSLSS